MATAYQVTGALINSFAVFNSNTRIGFNGTDLYTVVQSEIQDAHGDGRTRIGVFKSSDAGLTWALVTDFESTLVYDVCTDERGASAPYLHITFVNGDGYYCVSRFNMAIDDFDRDLVTTYNQSTIGVLSRLYIGSTATIGLRVTFVMSTAPGVITGTLDLDPDIYTAGTLTELPSQTHSSDDNYTPMAVGAGAASGAHPEGAAGWANYLCHVGPGTSKVRITLDGGYAADASDDVESRGRSSTRNSNSARETSLVCWALDGSKYRTTTLANTPLSDTLTQCDHSEIPNVALHNLPDVATTGAAALAGVGGEMYLLWFDGSDLRGKIAGSTLSGCAAWGAASTFLAVPAASIMMLGASPVPNGIGVLFSIARIDNVFPVDEWFDVWYVEIPISHGQIITGPLGIPSEEAFGKTHGVLGGGDPLTCGSLSSLPIPPGCNEPVLVPNSGDQDCGEAGGMGGYAF